jgi:tellurite resistance protein TehA-like permease
LRPVNCLARTLCAPAPARYIKQMEAVFPIFIVLAMLAVLGVLLFGVINMAKGGNPQRSNKLMQLRVWMQGAALLLFVIFMLLYHRH